MKFLRTEVKIFLVLYSMSVIAFFLIFAVGMALVYEHRIFSTRITVEFITNFVYSMSSYLLATATFSFLAHRLLRNTRAEIRIFVFAYGLSFITFFVTMFFLIPIYYGHVPFLWIDLSFLMDPYSSYQFSLFMLFLGILSLPPTVFFIVIYEIYRLTMKLTRRRNLSQEKKTKDDKKKT